MMEKIKAWAKENPKKAAIVAAIVIIIILGALGA